MKDVPRCFSLVKTRSGTFRESSIVTGGGGAPLYEQVGEGPYSHSQYFGSVHHCVSIAIDGGTLTGVGVQPDGTQFDPFTLHKPMMGDHSFHLPLVLRNEYVAGSTLIPPITSTVTLP